MMNLPELSIKRPVFITMLMMALAIFGYISMKELGVDLFPRVDFPVITVVSILPGTDPETIEKTVTEPIEEALSSISSIKHLRSNSTEGVSLVAIEFELEKDVDVAYQEVQAKINTTRRSLPEDLKEIVIEKFDIDSAPIMALVVSGDLSINKLSDLSENVIKDRLQQVSGVGQIKILGKQERNIWINLDPLKLQGLNLSVQEVMQAIHSQHIEMPGGRIETSLKEFTLRTRGEFSEVAELERIIVGYRQQSAIHLGDIAEIVDGFEVRRSLARLEGQEALALLVRRQSGTNTVSVAKGIKKEITRLENELQKQGVHIKVAQDLSVFIEHSIHEIEFHLLFGGLLAVIIVFIFLQNVRITLISALAIPLSVISSFILMKWMNFTMNNMTMLALSLSIGILIDDAIVVVENIFRHFKMGKSAKQAALEGTTEIALAAFAITMSIVAVFLPVAFMKGMIGQFFYEFGITVTFSVLLSLFVAFTLTPMLSSRFLKVSQGGSWKFINQGLDLLDQIYHSLLTKSLRFKKTTLLLAAIALFSTLFLAGQYMKAEFVPIEDQSEFFIKIKTPLGSSLGVTDEALEKIRREINTKVWVKYTFSMVGSGDKVNEGSLYVKMVDKANRQISQNEAMQDIRSHLGQLNYAKISVEPVPRVAGGGKRYAALQLEVRGTDLNKMESISQKLVEFLSRKPGYVDIDISYEKGKPEIDILLKRDRLLDLDVSPLAVGQTIKPLIGGADISKFRANGKRYPISLRLKPEYRQETEDLYNLSVRNQRGSLISLDNLVEAIEKKGPVQIDRDNRQRIINIYINFEKNKVLSEAMEEIGAFIKSLSLPEGYQIGFTGSAETMKESFMNLIFALILAVVMVYMVLASQFESFTQPLIIMISLPLSLIGSLGILILTQMSLNIFTMIGLIMLMGLVTKNAILLVDYINILKEKEQLKTVEAILKAGSTRLHPIMMTTLAMIFGMLPIALSKGEGSESQAPMAMAIIGGLASSTFLTLVVVPVIYLILEETQARINLISLKLKSQVKLLSPRLRQKLRRL